jgi:H+-translocating NAD(P) transhydrogenase subunit alpha
MTENLKMHVGVPRETVPGERRVAATPDTVKRLLGLGCSVNIETGAGAAAGCSDDDYAKAGASLVSGPADAYACDVVLKVRAPQADEIGLLKAGSTLFALVDPWRNPLLQQLAGAGIRLMALELPPRITRAQSMDVLSSQANIAGYGAVMLAASRYPRFFPMLMTAAGTVKAARVLVLGAGVAGLQAISAARRMGASVEGFDVRAAAREQVESLGARFVSVDISAEGQGGYASALDEAAMERLRTGLQPKIANADVVIATAQIPGKPAPLLVSAAAVAAMRFGSVLVDLAIVTGGNVAGAQVGETCTGNGALIIGEPNMPSRYAADASALFARNLYNFIAALAVDGRLDFTREPEIVGPATVCNDGQIMFGR